MEEFVLDVKRLTANDVIRFQTMTEADAVPMDALPGIAQVVAKNSNWTAEELLEEMDMADLIAAFGQVVSLWAERKKIALPLASASS